MNYTFYTDEMHLNVDEWTIEQECNDLRITKVLVETKDKIEINIGLAYKADTRKTKYTFLLNYVCVLW
ncbi:hypothetical protein P700755_001498 [Psychroflexus torquis ATCC 700755]|jgi:hypothetical protein|uniref:Uncharacterized protein n=1 Tax=Psychroflexus torquis (strain ATCC 700755 / CIP 106069 / ACAM 623) TaxID=313595 RepID=K4ICS6_PSYTT|nr:hypothetical protein [Psychroflexus torquis]AFU68392.1 hypothetical protein P700755_001498 [Psychroflexus torquis ATCC 700755]